MRLPPVRPAPRRATGIVAPLAAGRREQTGVRRAAVSGLLSSPLFWSMIAVMLVPATVVGVLVLLMHLAGAL